MHIILIQIDKSRPTTASGCEGIPANATLSTNVLEIQPVSKSKASNSLQKMTSYCPEGKLDFF